MRFTLTQIYNQKSRFVALMLCVWLSGATCVLSCEMGATNNRTQAKNASCPMKHHDCCKGDSAKSNKVSFDNSGGQNDAPTFDCCTFGNVKGETTRKFYAFDKFVSPVSVTSILFARTKQRDVNFRKSYKMSPQNRGETYIKNCVFLI